MMNSVVNNVLAEYRCLSCNRYLFSFCNDSKFRIRIKCQRCDMENFVQHLGVIETVTVLSLVTV
jgi:phage FluMu protein Com